MSLKSKFLSLSMKKQILIVIILLTLYSVLVILCLTCSFCHEILKEDYKQKKIYFYDRYKEFIETCFYFHNYCLLQYEEILKRMQNQIFKFHQKSTFFNYTSNFNNETSKNKVKLFNPNDFINNPSNNIYKNEENLFYYCYHINGEFCVHFGNFAKAIYDSLSSTICSHEINKIFNIPGYDIAIMSDPLLININTSTIFSFNESAIYNILIEEFKDFSNFNNSLFDYHNKARIEYMMSNIYIMFLYYYSDVLFMFDHMFEKTAIEISSLDEVSIINLNDRRTYYEFTKRISGYYSSILYPENKFSSLSYYNNQYYYIEFLLLDNYLYFINNRISAFLNFSIIALNYENNTIISPELCLLFLLKQYNYQIDFDKVDELYNKIKIGKSNITDCIKDTNIFNEQPEINNILIRNISHFMTINNSIVQGILNIENIPYYFVKYSYPSYSALKEFKSDYLLLNQVNYYLFSSFKVPNDFSNLALQVNKNLFYLIIIIIVYGWFFCLCINFLIYWKVIAQLTEPIKKLQEAIESSSMKEENIFKYDYDDFINELFLTSKELLTGQIEKNNDERGLDKFNILSIPKDKQKNIDINLYHRNLIINNNIMNQIIHEQQNMMDFSKNIKVNEELEENNDFFTEIQKYNKKVKNNEDEQNNEKENIEDKNNINQNKINEEKDREPFKKLFKISEFLYYYQNKIEDNYIHINNNIISDDSKKSTISNNINQNNSLNYNQKLKKPIARGNSYAKNDKNENFSINMLNNKNITYLWYMEAKKKKNKSFNYEIGNNYDELFNDFNNYQNN